VLTVPVNVGLANGANEANVVDNRVPFNLISGATNAILTVILFVVIPVVAIIDVVPTIPVNVGLANGANKFNAVCVAVDIGLLTSDVLSTFPSPTIDLVIPATVPVNVGLAKVAKVAKIVDKDVPFKLIVGVDIPPCATNNPLIVAIPLLINAPVIIPPVGALDALGVPEKIVESEK
jgi:hypothetical protein